MFFLFNLFNLFKFADRMRIFEQEFVCLFVCLFSQDPDHPTKENLIDLEVKVSRVPF